MDVSICILLSGVAIQNRVLGMVVGTLSRVFMIFLLVIAALFASNVYVIGVARF